MELITVSSSRNNKFDLGHLISFAGAAYAQANQANPPEAKRRRQS